MKMFVLRVSSLCMMRAIYLRFVIESDSRCDKKQRVVFFHFLVTTTVAAVFFFFHITLEKASLGPGYRRPLFCGISDKLTSRIQSSHSDTTPTLSDSLNLNDIMTPILPQTLTRITFDPPDRKQPTDRFCAVQRFYLLTPGDSLCLPIHLVRK